MEKVIIFDMNNQGHHFFYNYNVARTLAAKYDVTYVTSKLDRESYDLLVKSKINVKNINYIKIINRWFLNIYYSFKLFYVITYAMIHKVKKIHLIHFDCMILPMMINIALVIFAKIKINFYVTCHWIPNKNIKWSILNVLFKYNVFTKFIVHGNYIEKTFKENINSEIPIVSIDYPAREVKNYTREACFSKLNIEPTNDAILLYFGGTRYDKGLDLLINSLSYVNEGYLLLIAGKDEGFNEGFIKKLIKTNWLDDKKIIINLKYVNEEDVDYYFSLADIVVLPYRKIFLGQSGPLTEAIAHNCVVIGPNVGQLEYTLNFEGTGMTYKVEDTVDLGAKINSSILKLQMLKESYLKGQNKYKARTNINMFRKKYYDIFN